MKRTLLLFLLLVGGLAMKTTAQCDCGTGTDGVFHATNNTTLAGGTYNYTTFTIDAGMTVTVTGNQPLIIKATGKVTIGGTLNLSGGNGAPGVTFSNFGVGGVGVAGGYNGGNGVYLGNGAPGSPGTGPGAGGFGDVWGGGAGGGYGAAGSNGAPYQSGPIAPGGAAYGDIYMADYDGGSGGGGGSGGSNCGSGGGGAGGGILVMYSCDTIQVTGGGVIAANGGNGGSDGTGNCGGGGGGAGGTIWLISPTMILAGNLQATGGLGGTSTLAPNCVGGPGAVGRIRLDNNSLFSSGSITPPAGFTTTVLSSTTATSNTTLLCFGDLDAQASTTALGGGGFYQYSWTGGQTTASVTGLGAGQNVVTVTDTNGCTTMDTVTVTEPAQLASTGSSTDETTVSANDGTATVTVTGGTAPYTYLWSPSGSTTNPATGLDTGNHIVTITDDNGCTMMDTVYVNQGPLSVYTTIADRGMSVYPNPASNFLTVLSSKTIKGEVVIQLTDNLGRVLATEKYNNTSEFTLNTSPYATGNYLLRISAEGSVSNVPLSIVR